MDNNDKRKITMTFHDPELIYSMVIYPDACEKEGIDISNYIENMINLSKKRSNTVDDPMDNQLDEVFGGWSGEIRLNGAKIKRQAEGVSFTEPEEE